MPGTSTQSLPRVRLVRKINRISSALFLSNFSLLVINMQMAEIHMIENILDYETAKLRGKEFCTKLGYSFDNLTY